MKKIIIKFEINFPKKDYEIVKAKIDKNKFFGLKKISEENYEKLMSLEINRQA